MSWGTVKIGDVAEILPGFAFKSSELGDEGTPLIKIGNILDNGQVDTVNVQRLPLTHYLKRHEKYRLADRDIVIAMTGATAGKVGRVHASEGDVLLLNQRVAKFVPREIDPDFLWFAIGSEQYRAKFYALGGGAAQPNMSGPQIASVEIPLPDLPTQQRIAGILSAYDDLIENNRRRTLLLEQAARLLFREWFVHLRFPGHETAKIVDGLPEGWESVSLGDKAEIRKGRNITKETVTEGSVPVVAGGLKPAYFHNTANVKGPVITISASGANAGHVGLYFQDIWASDCSFISAVENPSLIFIHQTLRQNDASIRAMQKGAAQPHVYPKDLQRLPVVWPTDDLVEQFLGVAAPSYRQIETLGKQNAQLTRARDLLLPRLMDGRIPV